MSQILFVLACMLSVFRPSFDTQRMVMEIIYKWGKIDILIANAGAYMEKPVALITFDLESISQIMIDIGNNHQATPGFDICLLR